MTEKLDLSDGCVVDFCLDAKEDGQPDFMEAFQYLGNVVTPPAQWLPYHQRPDFEVKVVGERCFYVMKIWASRDALDLLKWRDVETEKLRIFNDTPPEVVDIEAIKAANGFIFSSD